MQTLYRIIAVGFILGLVCLGVACEYQLWQECRVEHSWFYCSRVLGGR